MKKPPLRAWIAVMIFFTAFTNYMLRANMAVSIVVMASKKSFNDTAACESEKKKKNKTEEEKSKPFDWDENVQGFILSAYTYGYLSTILVAGPLAEKFGAWHTILWSSVAGGVVNGLTPLMSDKLGWGGCLTARIIVGAVGSIAYPGISNLISRWAPPAEKGKFLASMMGNALGSVVSFTAVGFVSHDWGWEWGFYVCSIMMGVFCLVFGLTASSSPETHLCISEEERNYIFESQQGKLSKAKKTAPFKRIILSVPFWSLAVAQYSNQWSIQVATTYFPKYMSEILGFKIRASAGLSSLPLMARLFGSFFFGAFGDYLRKKEIMSMTKLRKFFVIFSHLLPATCYFLMAAAGCHVAVAVGLLTFSYLMNSAVVVGHLINPQDLSPNFAGTVYGMMNFIGTTNGLYVASIAGAIQDKQGRTLTAAGIIYGIGGMVLATGALVFMIFGSGEVQPWNEIQEEDKDS